MDLERLPFSSLPGIEWPAIPAPAGASMLAMQWQLEKSQWWSADQILDRQLEQVRTLVAHAAGTVPYYRDLLKKAGLSGVADLDEQDFRRLPLLAKAQLRAHCKALGAAAMPPGHGDVFEVRTSGSTGEPVRVLHSRMSEFFFHALVVREHLLSGRDLEKKFGAIRLAAPRARAPHWGVMAAMFRTGEAASIDALAGVESQLGWLLEERPAYLLAHPSNVRELVLHSAAAGKAPAGLQQVLTFGEMLPEDLRDLVRDHWGANVVDSYSCREIGPIAFQCPEGPAYHVHAENVVLEVLDEAGAACKPGETGRVVVTPLHNFAMPLLRYDLGDFAEVAPPCPCGRGLPALKRVVGRVTSMAVDPTGRRFWPGLRASLLTSIAPFQQLRLVQHDARKMELRYVMERDLSETQCAAAAGAIAEMLGYPFEVRCTRVPVLERGPGGKYEDFVSLLKPD